MALDGALDLTRAASCPEPQLLRLIARFPIAKQEIPSYPAATGESLLGARPSPLSAGGLPIHAHQALYGRILRGPLAVDGGTFTWLVGSGWTLTVDTKGDAVLHRVPG